MFELYVDSEAGMTPFSLGAFKTGSILILCSSVTSCATDTKSTPNAAHSPAPVSYRTTTMSDPALNHFAAYLWALRHAKADSEDVAQLRHIQLRELGEKLDVLATTATPTTYIQMPLIAAVSPPPYLTIRLDPEDDSRTLVKSHLIDQ